MARFIPSLCNNYKQSRARQQAVMLVHTPVFEHVKEDSDTH